MYCFLSTTLHYWCLGSNIVSRDCKSKIPISTINVCTNGHILNTTSWRVHKCCEVFENHAVPTKENIHVWIFISYSWHFLQKKTIHIWICIIIVTPGRIYKWKQYMYSYVYSLVTSGSTYKRKQCIYEYSLVTPGRIYKWKQCMYKYSLVTPRNLQEKTIYVWIFTSYS
jgi:hypothetical protein